MKRIIFVCFALMLSISLMAQNVYTSSGKPANSKTKKKSSSGFDRDRLILGGWGGAQFGNVTNINIAPIVGYRISDKLAAGISFGYNYIKYKDWFEVEDTVTGNIQKKDLVYHTFKTGVWARYLITDGIFVHFEPQYFIAKTTNYSFYGVPINQSLSVPAVLVGGGYRMPVSDRASFSIMLLYDVLQDKNSPYGNQVYTPIGFNIGF